SSDLGCDGQRIAELRHRTPLGLQAVGHRIALDGLPQMVFDLLYDLARERRIEIERACEATQVLPHHAGLLPVRLPLNRLPIASENCSHTARRSASACSPRRVSS